MTESSERDSTMLLVLCLQTCEMSLFLVRVKCEIQLTKLKCNILVVFYKKLRQIKCTSWILLLICFLIYFVLL